MNDRVRCETTEQNSEDLSNNVELSSPIGNNEHLKELNDYVQRIGSCSSSNDRSLYKKLCDRRFPNINHVTGKGNGKECKGERMLFERESEFDDKIDMIPHIESILTNEEMVPILYTGSIDECDFSQLEVPYIIKPRCQCGVQDIIQSTPSPEKVSSLKRKYMSQWNYRGRNNHVIIEQFIPNMIHYEVFVCDGDIKTIVLWDGNMRIPFDENWNRNILYAHSVPPLHVVLDKPQTFSRITALASKCGKLYSEYTAIPLVRIGIHQDETGNVMLGEFTGATCGGNAGSATVSNTFGTWWLDALRTRNVGLTS